MEQQIAFNPTKKLLTRAELDAYDPESETWQKQFSRRYEHHSELFNVLNNVENVNETVYKKFAIAISPYMVKLMDKDDPKCPIRLQYMPSHHEETIPGFATSPRSVRRRRRYDSGHQCGASLSAPGTVFGK